MKRTFLICLFALISHSLSSYAQAPQLGDYMVVDSVPSFVFYIDETGEHGLVMSFPASTMTTKKMKKMVAEMEKDEKKNAALAAGWTNLWIEKFKNGTLNCETFNTIIPKELADKLSDSGQDNQIAIVSYCKEKGIALEKVFPFQFWASQIGEDWYIPGDKELSLFANFYFGGVENKVTVLKNRAKAVSRDKRIQMVLTAITFNGLISSTSKFPEDGFRMMIHYTSKMGKQWFEFVDKYHSNFSVCAVHAF